MKRILLVLVMQMGMFSYITASSSEPPDRPKSQSENHPKSSEPYYQSSESAPWYDSYGRLRHGYKDTSIKRYPFGKEPYYYYSESTPWYDSYGRLRHGPKNTEINQPPFGKEPYYYYSDHTPWYDSYGNLRYGPKGLTAEGYERQKKSRN